MGLFSEKLVLDFPDSNIIYYPNFFSTEKAGVLFDILKRTIPWQQDSITLFGKTHLQPRLTALYGNNEKSYSYSNITMHPKEFTVELLQIKAAIEKQANVAFTTCLLNYYRSGKDSNGWHSDDEKELGKNPVIASVSFGAERFFHLRHKNDKTQKHKLLLEHGSLLIMQGPTQHFWQHQIAKTAKPIGERINLTFRVIK
ncbi:MULTISPECIES: alpha-ketoglutarate-dependent dioxygenase AlkB family protein [Flavobacteriaceae]|uniref:alpha-ketoglutarate-dependent dioxygenase AlkB family protein n=1 Tax=Flavobacteriaceae TaxID=49546 RepID=UPI001490EF6F|nr:MULTISPECIES: alpha-ketoglutarate-dependent dioxygenase AlkB [Allomuricauda]MDC6367745.1 alpha-ketoglutarate-dependent dioxygenase AlkB [Muricauda sp. AC10]